MDYTDYSSTPASNNLTPPDGAPEGMAPSGVNDTMRSMMAQVRLLGDLGDVLWGTVSGSGTPSWVRGNQAGTTPWLNALYEDAPGDISTLLAGIYDDNTSSNVGISGVFTAANDPTGTVASPRNLLTLLATNNGSATFVNGLLAIAQAGVNNTSVGHNLIAAGGGTPGAKTLVGLEIDQEFGEGDTNKGDSAGMFINTFSVDNAGALLQSGAVAGTWSNGIALAGIGPQGSGLFVIQEGALCCNSATIVNAGSGYAVNDIVTPAGGTLAFLGRRTSVKILTISGGGVVTGLEINRVGNYTTVPGSPATQLSTTGIGTGLTLSLGYCHIDSLMTTVGATLGTAAIRIGSNNGFNNQTIRFEDAALDGSAAATIFSDTSDNLVFNNTFANTFFLSNSTPVMQLTTAAVPNGATPMFLLVGNNAGPNFEAVTLGAADSGGAGFKVLRVPN